MLTALRSLAAGAWSHVRRFRLEGKLAAFVIFAGQSNALGFGMDPSTLPGELGKPDPLTMIWSARAKAYEVMQPGVNTGTANNPGAWAAEAAFARAFRRANPDEPLYILKSAKGSTGLAADPAQLDWSPASNGEMFDLTADQVAAARAAAGGVAVDAVFLVQGEQDATSEAWARDYRANLTDWLWAIRIRWMANPDGAIFYARVGETLTYADAVGRSQFQVDVADGKARSVGTADLARQPDKLHYAATAHVWVGEAFGRLFAAERNQGAFLRLARRVRFAGPGGR